MLRVLRPAWLCFLLLLAATTANAAAAPVDFFVQLDENEDGVLSGTEVRYFASIDQDADREVTRPEFDTAVNQRRELLVRQDRSTFESRDENQNGTLTGTELSGYEFADLNSDRRVTAEEFHAGMIRQRLDLAEQGLPQAIATLEERFGLSDVNEDGRLSGNEIQGWQHLDQNRDRVIAREEFVGGSLLDLVASSSGASSTTGPTKPDPRDTKELAWQTTSSEDDVLSFQVPGKPMRAKGDQEGQITYELAVEALQCNFAVHVFSFEQSLEANAQDVFDEVAKSLPEAVGGEMVTTQPANWKDHPGQFVDLKLGKDGRHMQRDILVGSRLYSMQWTAASGTPTRRREIGQRFLNSFGAPGDKPADNDAPDVSVPPAPIDPPAPAANPTRRKSKARSSEKPSAPMPPAPAAPTTPPAPDDAGAAQQAAVDAIYPIMLQAVNDHDYDRARTLIRQCITYQPRQSVHYYNLSCIESRDGNSEPALKALEQAVELGYADPRSMSEDRDLDSIRRSPKFAALAKAVARNAGEEPQEKPAPAPSPAPEPGPTRKSRSKNDSSATKLPAAEQPPAARFATGTPVGLYFMTRFNSFAGSLEKAVWYFAADGMVYEQLEMGFSPADLAAHQGRKGAIRVDGDEVTLEWTDGSVLNTELERNPTGFFMDLGNFVPVPAAATAAMIAGEYEGGESAGPSADRSILSRSLTLNSDGTFTWRGAAIVRASDARGSVQAGAAGNVTQGRWELAGYALTLHASDGATFRRIAFPYDDEKTEIKPDYLYFGGLMYKKR